MSERPITIVSLNVRGLGKDLNKQKLIRTWLASLQNPPQILLIQEHHLDEQGTANSTRGLDFWQGKSFWNPRILMGSSQRTSAGTAILVDKMTAPLVKEDKILIEGRVQYETLHLPDNSELSIVNTYTSRTSRSRAPLWRRISEANFIADHIIIGGDFNHLEEEETRGTAGQRRMHRRELAAWHQLTLQYGLTDAWTLDSFKKMSKKELTFDNGRKGQGSAVSKIDKFLVSQKLEAKGGKIEAAPSIRRISNHSPLVLTIWGRTSAPPTPTTYFDTALLKEEESRSALLDAWTGTQPTPNQDVEWPAWLEAASGRMLQCNIKITRKKKKAKGAQSQKPPTKNQPGGGSTAKKPRRRASQGNPLGGTRPSGRLAPRKGRNEPPAQLGLLVQIWGHVFKTFLRFSPNQEKAYTSQRAQNQGGGHHRPGRHGPLCSIFL
jgi:endonuclease/exonuclease/phosphatase family metal-dependent hydrolase